MQFVPVLLAIVASVAVDPPERLVATALKRDTSCKAVVAGYKILITDEEDEKKVFQTIEVWKYGRVKDLVVSTDEKYVAAAFLRQVVVFETSSGRVVKSIDFNYTGKGRYIMAFDGPLFLLNGQAPKMEVTIP